METKTKNNLYEGMFLVDSAVAASNWDGVNNTIKTILERAEAEIVSIRKWDDRKLAYEIHRVGRGVYMLCYFRANGERIKDIEKAVQLSEQIMRVLILNAEHMTAQDIEKDTPATKVEKEKQKGDGESDRDEHAGRQSGDHETGGAEKPETAEDIEKDTPATKAEKGKQKGDEESDRDEQAERQSSNLEAVNAEESETTQTTETAEKAEQSSGLPTEDSKETTEDEQESKPSEISND